jgi:branched-chain amino acid transport system ATP-binding protein
MNEPILQVQRLDAFFGDLQILWGIDLEVFPHEVVAIIGANGAGKTTLLRSVVGLHRQRLGIIRFQGQEIIHLPPHRLIHLGMAEVPDERGIFPELTVEKNLIVGAFSLKNNKAVRTALAWIYEMFPILRERRRFFARSLSGGEQQMLALGKGMMTRPKLLLLDEPSSGLAPVMVLRLMEHIWKIHKEGTTVLLVEQNVRHAFKMANRAYVMENGRMSITGTTVELARNDKVKRAYLGK